jgi:hypothetical protein
MRHYDRARPTVVIECENERWKAVAFAPHPHSEERTDSNPARVENEV